MTHRVTFLIACAVLLLAPATASAQNNVERQLFLEIRTLQAQVQQLTAAINAVNEHLGKTDTKVESQANAMTKGFADQKLLIDAIAGSQRTLSELQNSDSVRLLQLNQEMKAIREGLSLQQTLLNQILSQLPSAQPGASATPTDPNAPATPPTNPAGAKPGGNLPPSPGEYYRAAFGYFYGGMFPEAIEFLTDAIKRFPDSPEAARAQLTIGDANLQMGGHETDALAAYALVIKNYKDPEAKNHKDPDVAADAWLKQGDAYAQLGKKEEARKSYEEVRTQFPNSSQKIFAEAALRRLGYIK